MSKLATTGLEIVGPHFSPVIGFTRAHSIDFSIRDFVILQNYLLDAFNSSLTFIFDSKAVVPPAR